MNRDNTFLMRLFRITQKNMLKWEFKNIASLDLLTKEKGITDVFDAKLENVGLRIYRENSYRKEEESNISHPICQAFDDEVMLNIDLKKYGEECPEWRYSSMNYPIIKEIYNEICRKKSHIDDFIDDVLKNSALPTEQ